MGASKMAAGADVTQKPLSILGRAYKEMPMDAAHKVCIDRSSAGSSDDDDDKCYPLLSDEETVEFPCLGRPPRPFIPGRLRQCYSTTILAPANSRCSEMADSPALLEERFSTMAEFLPVIRSGVCTDIGGRSYMEDEHIRIDNLLEHLGSVFNFQQPGSYYGVFDGHGGKGAALFVKERLLKFIIEDTCFPSALEKAVRRAFLQADVAFAEACDVDAKKSSGTTAITVFIVGRNLLVANAGDCRAVLCRKGKAVAMSRDHKTECMVERRRIESLGGYVDDGYLNGQLAVTRALGDWHMEGLKIRGSIPGGPLSAEPEMQQALLTEDDEFLIIGCDGLWDVFTNENAIAFARQRLQQHNDPHLCSQELVQEAIRRNTCDNLTAVTVCLRADPPAARIPAPSMRVRRSISAEGLRNLQDLLKGSA